MDAFAQKFRRTTFMVKYPGGFNARCLGVGFSVDLGRGISFIRHAI